MESREHLDVLQQVCHESVPALVDARSGLPLAAVSELVSGGYLQAARVSEGRDPAWLNLTVTPQGRQHLRRLRELYPPRSMEEGFRRMVPLWLRVVLGFLLGMGALFASEIVSWLGVMQ